MFLFLGQWENGILKSVMSMQRQHRCNKRAGMIAAQGTLGIDD
jgi:hypothetical protein